MVWVFVPCTMHGVKNREGYHLANTHHGNLKTCTQKAISIIPVLADRSERMHVFYSSETIPPKMSRKKISGEAFSFKYMQCLSSRCPALSFPYDCLNSVDTHMSPQMENHSIVMYLFQEGKYKADRHQRQKCGSNLQSIFR